MAGSHLGRSLGPWVNPIEEQFDCTGANWLHRKSMNLLDLASCDWFLLSSHDCNPGLLVLWGRPFGSVPLSKHSPNTGERGSLRGKRSMGHLEAGPAFLVAGDLEQKLEIRRRSSPFCSNTLVCRERGHGMIKL